MCNADSWDKIQISKVDEISDNFSISKYNLLKISSIKLLIEQSYHYSDKCSHCKENLPILESMIPQIEKLDDTDVRSSYEKEFNNIRDHFYKQHGYVEPMHYTSRLSLILFLIGGILGLLYSYIAYKTLLISHPMIGAVLGVVIGYIVGNSKDGKLLKAHKVV